MPTCSGTTTKKSKLTGEEVSYGEGSVAVSGTGNNSCCTNRVMLKLRERSNFIHRLWKGFTNKLKVPRHPNAKKLTHDYKFEITLPDISCTVCTLQVSLVTFALLVKASLPVTN